MPSSESLQSASRELLVAWMHAIATVENEFVRKDIEPLDIGTEFKYTVDIIY